MTTVLHFRPDLAHIKVEASMKRHVLTGIAQEASLPIDRIQKFHLRSSMSLGLSINTKQGTFSGVGGIRSLCLALFRDLIGGVDIRMCFHHVN